MVLIYIVLIMFATPFVYEWVNGRIEASGRVRNVIKGFPSYSVNLIICAAEAVVVCVMPGGWGLSLTNMVMATAVIYLGNQFVYHAFVKAWSKARAAL